MVESYIITVGQQKKYEELKQYFSELNKGKDKKRETLKKVFSDDLELLREMAQKMRKNLHKKWKEKHKDTLLQLLQNDSYFQRIAVQKNGLAIQFIENPSEEVQLTAVQQN